MKATEQLKRLVEQMPDPDGRGMYTENIDKQKIAQAVAEIADGGAAHVLGLIELLGPPGSKENAKPHYALHCVVNHTLVVADEQRRAAFCQAIASQLENQQLHPNNRAFLCQQLQWAGRDESCPALGNVLLDADVSDAAAMALAAIGGERAASQLRAAVPRAQGKSRLNVIDALAAVADPNAAPIFRSALSDQDREVRIAAAAGLAKLGQSDAGDPLLNAADSSSGWERTQTTHACLVLAEKLAAAGKKSQAKQIYRRLQTTRTGDAEQHVRDAAARGLAAIG
jgi:hypothetical protein